MVVRPKPLLLISIKASDTGVPVITDGICFPVCITSFTLTKTRRPRLPPGWENAKSSLVNPRASSKAIANASPITKVAVVLAVGARPRGHASSVTCVFRLTVDAIPSSD